MPGRIPQCWKYTPAGGNWTGLPVMTPDISFPGALSSVAGLITEVYIPANITYIGPGAFDGLGSLMYIEVAQGNPNYYSAGGVLYTMSGEVVAAPVWF